MRDTLVDRVDKLAGLILAAVEGTAELADKLAAFEAVGRWVAIKHSINRERPKRRGFQDDTRAQQRARVMRRWHPDWDPDSTDGDGGPTLEALKARLPRGPLTENR
jgi:hypothetical protein